MGKRVKQIVFMMIVLIVIMLSCETEPGDVFTITITANKTGVTDGTKAYGKIIAPGDGPEGEALYSIEAVFTDGAVSGTIPEVPAGTYSVYVFIDVNDNADTAKPLPDTGDFVFSSEDYEVTGDQTVTIEDADWEAYNAYTISVTALKSGVSDGIKIYTKMVEHGEEPDAAALYSAEGTFSGGSATFTISDVAGGTYAAYVMIDINSNASVSDPLPDGHDYVFSDEDYEVAEDLDETIEDSDWIIFGYTLTVNCEDPDGAEGISVYGMLVEDGGDHMSEILYAGEAVFTSNTAELIIENIAPGSYEGFYLVDMNGNALMTDFMPDQDDYTFNPAGGVEIVGDAVDTIISSDWEIFGIF